MKAVVMQVEGGQAVLLGNDGRFVRIRNKGYQIGDVVTMQEQRLGKARFRAMTVAAAVCMLLLGGVGWAYATPYYYVSLDVNPSVMLEVNYFERVISIQAVNEDAAEILAGLNLKNKNVDAAVSAVVASIANAGYLAEGGNVYVGSAAENGHKAERLASELQETVKEEVEKVVEETESEVEIEVECKGLGYEMVQKARELQITPGKLNIITHVLGQEPTEENINMSVKELMTRYRSEKGNHHHEDAEEEEDSAEEAGPGNNAGKKNHQAPGQIKKLARQEPQVPDQPPVDETEMDVTTPDESTEVTPEETDDAETPKGKGKGSDTHPGKKKPNNPGKSPSKPGKKTD